MKQHTPHFNQSEKTFTFIKRVTKTHKASYHQQSIAFTLDALTTKAIEIDATECGLEAHKDFFKSTQE